ncbi:hypothetical protein [Kurthia sp. Dielmo]|uniref:hypothetical protein n=1 Tax=Kurthia sp. Dielmo TaxID=1033738 RepID=UPI0011210338|nr:hypothetical protein [Kurthia sp. Dielmo]
METYLKIIDEFDDYVVREHHFFNGTNVVIKFDNGYGVSVMVTAKSPNSEIIEAMVIDEDGFCDFTEENVCFSSLVQLDLQRTIEELKLIQQREQAPLF